MQGRFERSHSFDSLDSAGSGNFNDSTNRNADANSGQNSRKKSDSSNIHELVIILLLLLFLFLVEFVAKLMEAPGVGGVSQSALLQFQIAHLAYSNAFNLPTNCYGIGLYCNILGGTLSGPPELG